MLSCVRPSLFVFLASQDAKPKKRRRMKKRSPTAFPSTSLSGRRASPPLLPPPPRIARISGIFPPPTPPTADHGDNHGR